MISQTALRSGYHTANMVTQVPAGQFQTCDVARLYDQPNDGEDETLHMTTALENLVMATGADRATIAALIKSIADLTAVTKAQAEELHRIVNRGHITHMPSPAQHGSATVIRGYGRQRCTGNNEQGNWGRPMYKTKNNNYCWSHGYQVGFQHSSATCTERKEGHNPATTNTNIMGGDTWGF
jgi:hypothetical protein